MTEWEETTLGKICEDSGGNIQTGPFGSQLHASAYVPVGVPSIMPQNIGDNRVMINGIARITDADARRLSRYLVKSGDIVYSRRGDVERRALIRETEDGWLCGTGCLRVRFGDKKPISSTFISYYLDAPNIRMWIVQHAVGATMPNLNTAILSDVPVRLPPYHEQKAIADVLSTLDDKIELNRHMNQTLEATAQALFKSWFVDFDPVQAKAEGRKPEGMNDATAALFPSRFTDSPLGLIPEGWTVKTLERVSFLNSESWSRNNTPAQIEYVDLANTKWGTIESTQFFSWKDAPSRAQRILRKGDTIVGTVRPGNGSYSFISSDGLTGSTGFAVLRPKEDFYREFVYLSATSTENIARLTNLADGAAYPAVRPDVVYATSILFPGDEILLRFSQCLSPIMEKIEINKEENKTLGNIRDLLIPRLISGKLRVSDLPKEAAAS